MSVFEIAKAIFNFIWNRAGVYLVAAAIFAGLVARAYFKGRDDASARIRAKQQQVNNAQHEEYGKIDNRPGDFDAIVKRLRNDAF